MLLRKLKAYIVTGKILEWISDFLTGRRHTMVVNGKLSSWADILSGVHQASVTGAILFVIFINDLPDVVSSTTKIFADDTKLFRAVQTIEDHPDMQLDPDWSHKWQLGFNEAKCKSLHLGSSNQRLKYQMETEILGDIRIEKNLGGFIDEELKFYAHISKTVKKYITLVMLNRATFTCL